MENGRRSTLGTLEVRLDNLEREFCELKEWAQFSIRRSSSRYIVPRNEKDYNKIINYLVEKEVPYEPIFTTYVLRVPWFVVRMLSQGGYAVHSIEKEEIDKHKIDPDELRKKYKIKNSAKK